MHFHTATLSLLGVVACRKTEIHRAVTVEVLYLHWAFVIISDVFYNYLAVVCLRGTTVIEINLSHLLFPEYKIDIICRCFRVLRSYLTEKQPCKVDHYHNAMLFSGCRRARLITVIYLGLCVCEFMCTCKKDSSVCTAHRPFCHW